MTFEKTEFLTFDCYGTLIDWEAGIIAVLRPILDQHDVEVDDASLLATYAELEAEAAAGPFVAYREILGRVVDGIARRFDFEATPAQKDALAASVADWPPFPDTQAALRRLSRRFKLVILSNIDDDLFEGTARRLDTPFHRVFTAQQIGSYKPATANFEYAMEKLGGGTSRIVHVAQSLYHDIAPANRLGLRTVWINRREGLGGTGATPPAEASPDLQFSTLEAFAEALGV
jgi:2-haloacid dehalogenase